MVKLDAIGLYTNITHKEGFNSLKEQLNKRKTQIIPTDFLVNVMEIIFNNNIFELHETYWRQEIGAAMGSKTVPHYANTLMSKINKIIKSLDKEKIYFFYEKIPG